MKPFVVFVGNFQPLTNVTKDSMSGVAGVLDLPLEHYGVNIVQVFKLSKVAGLQSAAFKNELFHRHL